MFMAGDDENCAKRYFAAARRGREKEPEFR